MDDIYDDDDDDDDFDVDELNELEASLSKTSLQINEPGSRAWSLGPKSMHMVYTYQCMHFHVYVMQNHVGVQQQIKWNEM